MIIFTLIPLFYYTVFMFLEETMKTIMKAWYKHDFKNCTEVLWLNHGCTLVRTMRYHDHVMTMRYYSKTIVTASKNIGDHRKCCLFMLFVFFKKKKKNPPTYNISGKLTRLFPCASLCICAGLHPEK